MITKKINLNTSDEITAAEFIHNNFPAIQSDEFNIQAHLQTNNSCFVSLIRSSNLNTIVEEIRSIKAEIADVIIGPAAIIALQQLLSGFNQVNSAVNSFNLLNDYVEEIEIANSEIKIINLENLSFNTTYLLSIAIGFGYLTQQNNSIDLNKKTLFKERHLEEQKFKTVLYSLITLAFLLCLINFFLFSNYFSSSNKLQTELDVYQGKYEQINELLENYEKKKVLIEKTGLLENNPISKFADKIASTIPEEVIITEMIFNPINLNEEDSLVAFSKNQLIIKGNCNKSLLINEWVNILKSQSFIQSVSLEKFLFKTESSQPNFELMVETK
ncbi:MAG: hypothetical protein JNK50_01040 [Bacteroidia bacterium]|nr:hypothetical protein [Bacteroidia bacterium]